MKTPEERALTYCEEIRASDAAVEKLRGRWTQNEALYNLDPMATTLAVVEGFASHPVPLWRPKANRIISTVYNSLTQVEPFVQVFSYDQTDKSQEEQIENLLMIMATKQHIREDSFGYALYLALKIAVNTNAAVIYTYPDTASWDMCFRAVHPRDFVIYPAEAGAIPLAKTVGHRFTLTRSEITRRFKSGEFLTDRVAPGGMDYEAGKSVTFSRTDATVPVQEKDDLISLYQIITTSDEGKRVLAVVCPTSKALLKEEPYPYDGGLYFDIRLDSEYGSFWPANSPGQDMQSLQLLYTDAINVLIAGSWASAFPMTYVVGGIGSVKARKMVPGSIMELPAGFTAGVLGVPFNPGVLPQLLGILSELADSVSGISQLGTSQNLPPHTTATAAQGVLAAQAEAKDSYTRFVAPTVARIFAFLWEVFKVHPSQFEKRHRGMLRIDRALFEKEFIFEATGESTNSNPQALLAKLQMLAQMAGNPQSSLSYAAVERQIIESLNLPVGAASLAKPPGPQLIIEGIQAELGSGAKPEQILQGVAHILAPVMQEEGVSAPQQAQGPSIPAGGAVAQPLKEPVST